MVILRAYRYTITSTLFTTPENLTSDLGGGYLGRMVLSSAGKKTNNTTNTSTQHKIQKKRRRTRSTVLLPRHDHCDRRTKKEKEEKDIPTRAPCLIGDPRFERPRTYCLLGCKLSPEIVHPRSNFRIQHEANATHAHANQAFQKMAILRLNTRFGHRVTLFFNCFLGSIVASLSICISICCSHRGSM